MILLEIDPDVVKPGWTPLIVTVLLALAVVVLFLSMRRQLRRISIPREDDLPQQDDTPREDTADEAPAVPAKDAATREGPPAQ